MFCHVFSVVGLMCNELVDVYGKYCKSQNQKSKNPPCVYNKVVLYCNVYSNVSLGVDFTFDLCRPLVDNSTIARTRPNLLAVQLVQLIAGYNYISYQTVFLAFVNTSRARVIPERRAVEPLD